MDKQYKKINEDTIEETDSKTERTLHDIKSLKEQRVFLQEELRKIEEILGAVGEIKK